MKLVRGGVVKVAFAWGTERASPRVTSVFEKLVMSTIFLTPETKAFNWRHMLAGSPRWKLCLDGPQTFIQDKWGPLLTFSCHKCL